MFEIRKTEVGTGITPNTADLLKLKRIGTDVFLKYEAPLGTLLEMAKAIALEAITPLYTQAIATAIEGVNTTIAGLVRDTAPVAASKDTINLTLANVPLEGEAITIGTETFTFTATPVGDFDVEIGGNQLGSQSLLIDAITAHSQLVDIGSFIENVAVLTNKTNGAVGLAVSSTLSADGDGFSAEAMSGGTDGTVCNKNQLFVTSEGMWVAVDDCTVTESNFRQIKSFGE